MKTILSGVKPTGLPHLGNYFGAIKQHIDMQDKFKSYIFIADLHSLTTERDPEALRRQTLEVAKTYIALGLDLEKTIFFKQSNISAHAELCWILNCITPMGVLKRAHAWKDAEEKGLRESNVGLFDYPVLMAADILLYSPDLIPVGKDQKQHIEMARDIAKTFNHLYGETFKIPEPYILEEVETVPGVDGQKMSKSYDNTIELFASDDDVQKAIYSITTDSTPLDEPKDYKNCNVYALCKLFKSETDLIALQENYEKGGFGYGDFKGELLGEFMEKFGEARKKYKNPDFTNKEILAKINEGAANAKKVADEKLAEIKEKIGLK